MTEGKNNFTIGRGRVYIDDRYVGNTSHVRFEMKLGIYRITIVCEDISPENLDLFFGGVRPVSFKYVPFNPAGKQIAYEIDRMSLRPGSFNVKGEEWQGLVFELRASEKGALSNMHHYEMPEEAEQ